MGADCFCYNRQDKFMFLRYGTLPWLYLILLCPGLLSIADPVLAFDQHSPPVSLTEHFSSGDIRLRHLGIQDGLSHTLINDILQDQRGFLWIATVEGLSRYDGVNFKHFPRGLDLGHELPGSIVAALLETPDGILWISGGEGFLSRFDPSTERFKHFFPPESTNNPPRFFTNAFDRDPQGRLWIGSNVGLFHFDPHSQSFQHYPLQDHLGVPSEDQKIYAMLRTSTGDCWVGGPQGLHLLQPAGHFQAVLPTITVEALAEAPGGLWVGTQQGLLYLDNPTAPNLSKRWWLRQQPVQSLVAADPAGQQVWVGTDEGFYLADSRTGQIIPASHNPQLQYLGGQSLTPLALDHQAGLWINAQGSGLLRLTPSTTVFQHHPLASPVSSQEQPIPVLSLGMNDNQLWIGSWGEGLYRQTSATQVEKFHNPGPHHPGQNIAQILQDPQGTLWVGSYDAGLSRWDTTEQRFVPAHLHPSWAYTPPIIQALTMDRQGQLWIGTRQQGLFRYLPAATELHHYEYQPQCPHSLSTNTIHSVYEDQRGTIWVGTGHGLHRYRPDSDDFQRFQHRPDEPHSLSDNVVKAILEDHRGKLWVTTNLGLNVLDRDSGQFQVYTTHHGLPHNRVNSILEDQLGFLWLGTANGLSRFNPTRERFTNFGPDGELAGRLFYYPAATRSANGELFFGGPGGLVSFQPAELLSGTSRVPSMPRLTDLHLYHEPVPIAADSPLTQALDFTQELHLDAQQRSFRIDFAVPEFHTPGQLRYHYQLEGFDDNWQPVPPGQRSAIYTTLPPGNYRFRVRAALGLGPWGPENAHLAITVQAPWWATGWFRLSLALGLMVLLSGGYRYRILHLRQEGERLSLEVARKTHDLRVQMLQGIVREETLRENQVELQRAREAAETANRAKDSFLANISHELRTPLNSIIGLNEALANTRLQEQQHAWLGTQQHAAEHLLSILNDLLDYAKIDAGGLQLEDTVFSPHTLLEDLRRMLDPLAAQRGLELIFEVTGEAPLPQALRGDPLRLRQILLNLLNNALKFTPQGQVTLELKVLNPSTIAPHVVHLEFAVRDTGPGIEEAVQQRLFQPFQQADSSVSRRHGGTGLGLAISRRLVALMGAEIHLQSTLGQGSCFSFTLELPRAETLPSDPVEDTLQGLANPHILVVEDFPANQLVAKLQLHALGARVTIAEDGASALEAVATEDFDAILLDLHLPDTDGFHVCQQLRAQGATLPIIALSADTHPRERHRCLAVGMNDHLGKPYRRDDLARMLQHWLPPAPAAPKPAPAANDCHRSISGAIHYLIEELGAEGALGLLQLASQQLPDLAAQLGVALRQGDSPTARAVVHQLRGSLSHYAGTHLSPLLTRVSDGEVGHELAKALEQEFGELHSQLTEAVADLTTNPSG